MNLSFDCPVCDLNLQISTTATSGPCPRCGNTIKVAVSIAVQEGAQAITTPSRPRKPNWRCSGTPHGVLAQSAS